MPFQDMYQVNKGELNPGQKPDIDAALGENCALAANQSVDCHTTIVFTISLNSAGVWNRGFNWPVFSVGMHKKSPNAPPEKTEVIQNIIFGLRLSATIVFKQF